MRHGSDLICLMYRSDRSLLFIPSVLLWATLLTRPADVVRNVVVQFLTETLVRLRTARLRGIAVRLLAAAIVARRVFTTAGHGTLLSRLLARLVVAALCIRSIQLQRNEGRVVATLPFPARDFQLDRLTAFRAAQDVIQHFTVKGEVATVISGLRTALVAHEQSTGIRILIALVCHGYYPFSCLLRVLKVALMSSRSSGFTHWSVSSSAVQ